MVDYPPELEAAIVRCVEWLEVEGIEDGVSSVDYAGATYIICNGLVVDVVTQLELELHDPAAMAWAEARDGDGAPIPARARRAVWEATEGRMCVEQAWVLP
jgi:hypothetical protein